MNNIEKRASRLVGNLDFDRKTRQELKAQYVDHLNNLQDEYIQNGLNQNDASVKAFTQFGNNIEQNLRKNFCINNTFRKIMVILLFLSIALIAICFLNPATNEGDAARTIRSFGYTHSIKLIPFKTLPLMFTRNSPYVFWFLYILLFVPLGALIPFGINRYFNNSLIIKCYIASILAVQLIRAIFPVGLVNVDIAMLNFIGCMIGFLIFKFILFKMAIIFKSK
ncbi:VanZ family protein [Ruminiclostridium josui]|uniref:VanZ family protein n=1 Tax=Ruminiclostridium josui TaxID=1499 RepID=UPI00046730FA|nr:VanZ family protein [Ruminiclostridium josui]